MKLAKFVVAALAVLMLAGGGNPFGARPSEAQSTATFNFKIADDSNPGETLSDVGQWFADEVTKRSNGRVTIKHFTSSTLGSGSAIVQGARAGWMDISDEGMSYYISIVPELAAFTLPYMFESPDQARRAANSAAGRALLAKLRDKGLVGLGVGTNGWIDVITRNKPIKSPADFAGLRLRTLPSAVDVATMKALGAEPVNLESSQIYVSLQQGLVDGAEVTFHLTSGAKLYEVTKNYNLTHQAWLPFVMAMNAATFDKMPPDLQQLVSKVAQEAVNRSWAEELREDALYEQKLRQGGMVFTTYSKKEEDAFQAITRPLYASFAKTIGEDNLKGIAAAR